LLLRHHTSLDAAALVPPPSSPEIRVLLPRQETVKTRMQVTGAGIGTTVSGIVRNEGIPAFWKGTSCFASFSAQRRRRRSCRSLFVSLFFFYLFPLPPASGLFFAYGREISYTSIKLGAYAPVRDALGAGKDAPFYLKFLAGAITGGVGSFVGNPFDVLKTLQVGEETFFPAGEPLPLGTF
jgi:hypothetical protein